MLFEGDLALQRIELLGHFGLPFKLFELGIELTQNVFYTGEVFAGVGQAVFSFASTLFVFRDTRGFF